MSTTQTPQRNGHAQSELLDTKLPSDWTTEANVVGGLLTNPHLLDTVTGLRAILFLHDDTRIIFKTVMSMKADGEPVDVSHLSIRLKRLGMWETIGGAAKIGEIIQAAVAPSLFGHYLQHARDLATRRQIFFNGLRMIQGAHSRDSLESLVSEARVCTEALDAIRDPADASLEYRTLSCAELDSTEREADYLVTGTLVAGQPAILAGPPKSLKTSLLTDLAISLGTGTPFLGCHAVPRAIRVLVMSGESGQAASRVCFRSVARSKGYNLAEIETVFWCDDVPRIGHPAHTKALDKHLRKYQPELLAIDPAYRALLAGKPEDMFAMGALLGEVNDHCAAAGCTLLLVHHSRKSQAMPFAPTGLDDLSWAGFREFFRQWLLISRRQTYEPGSGVHDLRLDVGGSARHSWCAAVTVDEGPFAEPRWAVTVRGIAESKEVAQEAAETRKVQAAQGRREADRKRLVDAAAHFPEGETIRQLRERAGLSGARATTALADALQGGDLVACEFRKHTRNESGYKLAL